MEAWLASPRIVPLSEGEGYCQADAAASVQRLVTVLDSLREAGAGELALTTVPAAPPP